MSKSGSFYKYNFRCPNCGFDTDAKSERHLKIIGRLHSKKTGCAKNTYKINTFDPINLKKEKRTIINFNDMDALIRIKANNNWTQDQIDVFKTLVQNKSVTL